MNRSRPLRSTSLSALERNRRIRKTPRRYSVETTRSFAGGTGKFSAERTWRGAARTQPGDVAQEPHWRAGLKRRAPPRAYFEAWTAIPHQGFGSIFGRRQPPSIRGWRNGGRACSPVASGLNGLNPAISPIVRAVTGLDRRAHGGRMMLDQAERWLTYAEAGELLGISAEAARAMARRNKWPRRTPNEHNAPARVLIPSDRPVAHPRPPAAQGTPSVHPGDARGTNGMAPGRAEEPRPPEPDRPAEDGVLRSAIRALESAVDGLREQLQRTEQWVDHERERADASGSGLIVPIVVSRRR